jgi:hypothetical protein
MKLPAVAASETASWGERWLGWSRGGCSLGFGHSPGGYPAHFSATSSSAILR